MQDSPRRSTTDAELTAESRLPRLSIGPHFEMHPIVFPAGAIIVFMLVLVCMLLPRQPIQDTFTEIRDWIGYQFGWLYVASMSGFLGLAGWLAIGPYGDIRLGGDDSKPEFSRVSWFAMLFSAGMGIGLLFFSVAEPITHFTNPPPGFAEGIDPSRLAMAVTIFHWGLHPWALYAIVGLALAYYGFRKEMPLSFRSLLYPLFGDRVWGRLGDAVDTLAVISTLTGVATSLGIGAQQVNAGLSFLFGIPSGTGTQVGLIAAITAVATVSVCIGLDGGIRRLSEINLVLAVVLMGLVVLGTGLISYLTATIENTGAYLQVLPFNSFRTGAYTKEGRSWLNLWTVFFWAWWISWSPFVGMFIARVSRGRKIREFVMGVLLVPTIVSIAWMTAFGSTTLRQHTAHLEQTTQDASADDQLPTYWVADVDEDGTPVQSSAGTYQRSEQALTAVEYYGATVVDETGTQTIDTLATVLFTLIESVFQSKPLVVLAAGVATLCIILFFVTSSDSASMVIDIIASGGNPNPPVLTRLFWAISEGVVASMLLLAGGLQALQAAAVAAALPLLGVLLLACVGLLRALSRDQDSLLTFDQKETHD